jgi:hypothetical protein
VQKEKSSESSGLVERETKLRLALKARWRCAKKKDYVGISGRLRSMGEDGAGEERLRRARTGVASYKTRLVAGR